MGSCASKPREEDSQKDIVLKWRASHSSSVRSSLVARKKCEIEDDYYVYSDRDNILGKGACGVVVVGEKKNQHSDKSYAIKICCKEQCDVARLERELLLLKDVDHCNIVRLFEVYDTPTRMHFVTELCSGGHLGSLINKQKNGGFKRFEEEDAKVLSRQLLSAVRHMHERGIAHRDIKLQNILIDRKLPSEVQNGTMAIGDAINLKIIDFGYGSRYVGCCPMKTVCGTPYTTAPEVLRESYDERCDVWSVGVVTFIMLSGKRPFESLNVSGPLTEAGKAAMTTNILAGRYSFGTENWRGVSTEAKDFVKELLHPHYQKRVHAREAMLLSWMKDLTSTSMKMNSAKIRTISKGLSSGNITVLGSSAKVSPDTASDDEATSITMSEPKDRGEGGKDPPHPNGAGASTIHGAELEKDQLVVANILNNNKDTSAQGSMRRCGNMALAFGLHENAVRDIRTLFQTVDLDGSGALNKTEFAEAMIILCPSLQETDCDLVFNSMDINRDDQITFTEFLAATINPHAVDIEELNNAFTLLDSNNDGFISLDELRKMYAYKHMKKRPSRLSRQSDSEGDAGDANNAAGSGGGEGVPPSASQDGASTGESADGAERSSLFPRIFTDVMETTVSLEEQVERMMTACDIDHDGMISHEEFIFAMTGALDLFQGDRNQASQVLSASASKSKLRSKESGALPAGEYDDEECKTPTPKASVPGDDSRGVRLDKGDLSNKGKGGGGDADDDEQFSEERRKLSLTPKASGGGDLSVLAPVEGDEIADV